MIGVASATRPTPVVAVANGARIVSAEDSPAFNALAGRVAVLESDVAGLAERVTATEASLNSILAYNYIADFEAGLL